MRSALTLNPPEKIKSLMAEVARINGGGRSRPLIADDVCVQKSKKERGV